MNDDFDNMTYSELLEAAMTSVHLSGKQARRLHRALKRYGDGLDLLVRYPLLPLVVSLTALVVAALVLFSVLPR